MPEFLSLPNELILEITEKLPLHDINALLKTNRRFSDLLKTTLLNELFHSCSLTHGRRLLYQLASQQDLIGVRDLVARGILDFTERETLLHEAVKTQSVQALQTLLHFILTPDLRDSKRRTPLGLAVKLGRVDCVRVLAARPDVDLDWPNYKLMTPLLLAVKGGQEEMVRILVQATGDDPLPFGSTTRKSCFHLAALRQHVPILRCLLDYMDPNEVDDYCQTALHMAARAGSCPAVECLLADERVDANAQDYEGGTVFHVAVGWQQVEIVKLLLSYPRVGINIGDLKGRTPLHVAVGEGNFDTVRLLLSSPEVDLSLLDSSSMGNTALHIAIIWRSLEIVQLFVEHSRVDINLPNRLGKSPLELAGKLRRASVILLLQRQPGIDLMLDPSNGEGALDIANPVKRATRMRVLAYIKEVRSAAGELEKG